MPEEDHAKYAYEGGWNNDQKSGIGIEYVREKMIYNGAFKNGKRHGSGTLYDSGDLDRHGNFNNGHSIGLCTQRLSNGATFKSSFNKDVVLAGSKYEYTPMDRKNILFFGTFDQNMNKSAWSKFFADTTSFGKDSALFSECSGHKCYRVSNGPERKPLKTLGNERTLDAEIDYQIQHNMSVSNKFLSDMNTESFYYKSSVNSTDNLTYATMIRDPDCVDWDNTTVLYKWNAKALLLLITTMKRVDFVFEECNHVKILQMKCAAGGKWLDCNIQQNWRVDGLDIWNSWFTISPCNYFLSYKLHFLDEEVILQIILAGYDVVVRSRLIADYDPIVGNRSKAGIKSGRDSVLVLNRVASLPTTCKYPLPIFDEYTLSTSEKRVMIEEFHKVIDFHCNHGSLQVLRKANISRIINSNLIFFLLKQVRKVKNVNTDQFFGTNVQVKLVHKSTVTGEEIFYNTANVGELMAIGDKGFFCLECYSPEIQDEIFKNGGIDVYLERVGFELTGKELTVSLRSFFDIVVSKKFTSMTTPQTNNPMKSMFNASSGKLYWISEIWDNEWFCLFVLMWFLTDGAFSVGHLHSANGITLQMSSKGYLSVPSAIGGFGMLVARSATCIQRLTKFVLTQLVVDECEQEMLVCLTDLNATEGIYDLVHFLAKHINVLEDLIYIINKRTENSEEMDSMIVELDNSVTAFIAGRQNHGGSRGGFGLGVAVAVDKVSHILQNISKWVETSPIENREVIGYFRAFFEEFPQLRCLNDGTETTKERMNLFLTTQPDIVTFIVSAQLISDLPEDINSSIVELKLSMAAIIDGRQNLGNFRAGLGLGVADSVDNVSHIIQYMSEWVNSSQSENIALTGCFGAFFAKFPQLRCANDGIETPAKRKKFLLLHGPDLSEFVRSLNLIADIPLEIIFAKDALIAAFSELFVKVEIAHAKPPTKKPKFGMLWEKAAKDPDFGELICRCVPKDRGGEYNGKKLSDSKTFGKFFKRELGIYMKGAGQGKCCEIGSLKLIFEPLQQTEKPTSFDLAQAIRMRLVFHWPVIMEGKELSADNSQNPKASDFTAVVEGPRATRASGKGSQYKANLRIKPPPSFEEKDVLCFLKILLETFDKTIKSSIKSKLQ